MLKILRLSGQQRKKLQEALIDAFRDKASLERMLAFELDKNLDAIAGGNSLQDIVFNLIETAEAQGWIEDLVNAARESNPGNHLLKATAEGLLPNYNLETLSISSPNIPQKQETAGNNIYHSYPDIELEYPDGYVPLNSSFYIELQGRD
ncbi:effector-associated domain EAD1-containing protein [Aetokthonos hydrillicola Thurmond2011]|jgi:hypothetical protein|uniref:Effector-associated domain EAD1-containing protein n=1 Tax=Aetokthonos hydrillicola Thurmond2011 TaxID=2712845 RepID=A0AAP5MAE1_9CYAN|nr:effector-associated domain EAD1-containing protein [Aetokthonos hydrillicola]MBW4590780.1 hypothetical protein [Aetokthonos hydrillicola CCALA 1050]MDR9898040.1 effector-associated domain EAD1-containing protein [Aetokthonos hydrillicola Thurmond2011]